MMKLGWLTTSLRSPIACAFSSIAITRSGARWPELTMPSASLAIRRICSTSGTRSPSSPKMSTSSLSITPRGTKCERIVSSCSERQICAVEEIVGNQTIRPPILNDRSAACGFSPPTWLLSATPPKTSIGRPANWSCIAIRSKTVSW